MLAPSRLYTSTVSTVLYAIGIINFSSTCVINLTIRCYYFCLKQSYFLKLLIYLYLALLGLHRCVVFSLVALSECYSLLWCVGFSPLWFLLLQSIGLQAPEFPQLQHMGSIAAVLWLQSMGSIVLAHGLSCFVACGIFSDQGLNPCLLHWQADSSSLSHKGNLKARKMFILTHIITISSALQSLIQI